MISYSFHCLKDYDALYLSGITLAILPPSVGLALLEYLNQSAHILAFDSNYRPALWPEQNTAKRLIAEFWKRTDLALPSIDDEMLLMQESAENVTDRFIKNGLSGALKRGAQGPVSLGESVDQTYLPAQKVVDTTAAGDSFNSEILVGLLRKIPINDAINNGVNLAKKVIVGKGALVPSNA